MNYGRGFPKFLGVGVERIQFYPDPDPDSDSDPDNAPRSEIRQMSYGI